jgi:hypothetical protein
VKPGRGILAIALVFTLCFVNAAADDTKISAAGSQHLCQENDLKGTYVMVDFHETPAGAESSFHDKFPYQYLAFNPKHSYSFAAFAKAIKSKPELERFLPHQEDGNKKYILRSEGLLELYTGSNIVYNYRCVVSLADAGIYKKGDLSLTGYTKKQETEFYKLYRHWY